MLDHKAVTKIQSIILIIIIVAAVIGSVFAYSQLSRENQASGTIKIGFLGDLDSNLGKNAWQGALLAVEQINAEGGILGKQLELVGEDHDIESGLDTVKVSSALNRLIAYHGVDFIIGQGGGEAGLICQDIVAEHKKIFFDIVGSADELTQRVLDQYDKYKYYFTHGFNSSSAFSGVTGTLMHLRNLTGFNNVGYLAEDLKWAKDITGALDSVLSEVYGFDLVYAGTFPLGTIDYSSYLAAAETAGTELLLALFWVSNGVPFVKEWHDRQSPILVQGGILAGINDPSAWETTGGKCDNIVVASAMVTAGYPLTSKTLPFRDAYIERWGETPWHVGGGAFEIIRYILSDAITRSGTTETNAVIEALEQTNIETTQARTFAYTSSHAIMVGDWNDPNDKYSQIYVFQWKNGKLIPIFPEKIMEEAGATLTFPDWPGPWG